MSFDNDSTRQGRRKRARTSTKSAPLAKASARSETGLEISTWRPAPLLSWSGPRKGSWQAAFEEFALLAQHQSEEARTNLDVVDRSQQVEAEFAHTLGEVVDGVRGKQLEQENVGAEIDVWVLRLRDDSQEDQAVFEYHLQEARLPLWVASKSRREPNPTMDAATYAATTRAVRKDKRLTGRMGTEGAGVFDSGAKKGESNPRQSDVSEFERHMVSGRLPKSPLNWVDLANVTSDTFTPNAIARLSLKAILDERENIAHKPDEFFLASTLQSISNTHVDNFGAATWVRPLQGSKTWLMPVDRGSTSAMDYFCREGPDSIPGWMQFRSFVLNAIHGGGYWVQAPGQLHAVITNDVSFFVGGHFYSAGTFHQTIQAMERQLFRGAMSNEELHGEGMALLTRIARSLLDETIFNPRQQAQIAEAVVSILDQYNKVLETVERFPNLEVRLAGITLEQLVPFLEALEVFLEGWNKQPTNEREKLLEQLKTE